MCGGHACEWVWCDTCGRRLCYDGDCEYGRATALLYGRETVCYRCSDRLDKLAEIRKTLLEHHMADADADALCRKIRDMWVAPW